MCSVILSVACHSLSMYFVVVCLSVRVSVCCVVRVVCIRFLSALVVGVSVYVLVTCLSVCLSVCLCPGIIRTSNSALPRRLRPLASVSVLRLRCTIPGPSVCLSVCPSHVGVPIAGPSVQLRVTGSGRQSGRTAVRACQRLHQHELYTVSRQRGLA